MIRLTGKRYAVTGGAGFIGSHICEEIVRQGKSVVCIDNEFRRENLESWWNPELCTFVMADVSAPSGLLKYLDGVDVVFHEACSKCTVCRVSPQIDLATNAFGTLNVCLQAIESGVGKVVHASTGSVSDIQSFYGVSKSAAENYLKVLSGYYPRCRWTALRYHHVYGPRQNADKNGGVIPIFLTRAMRGEFIEVFGGLQVRHFTWVKDVVSANFIAAENEDTDGVVYDVVSDVSVTVSDLAEKVAGMATAPVDIVHSKVRPGEIFQFRTDNEPMKVLGWRPDNDFDSRLQETKDWYASTLQEGPGHIPAHRRCRMGMRRDDSQIGGFWG